MARTPLMRSLQKLAGEHAAAERLGIEVAELRAREAEAEAGLSRREFLRRAGAAGAAATVLGSAALARPARAAGAPRIAIVGGGIAGL
jgi:monoamine oxidase